MDFGCLQLPSTTVDHGFSPVLSCQDPVLEKNPKRMCAVKWDNEQLPQRNAASPKETNVLFHPTRVGIVNGCKCFSQRNVNIKSYFFSRKLLELSPSCP